MRHPRRGDTGDSEKQPCHAGLIWKLGLRCPHRHISLEEVKGHGDHPFLKCKLNVAACKGWVRSPLRLAEFKEMLRGVTPVRGIPKHFRHTFEAQDFLVRQEKGNLHFSLEKVPIASPPPPPPTSQAPTETCMEVLTKPMKSIVTSGCPAGATRGSHREEFPLSSGLLGLIHACEKRNENFLSDVEHLVCALQSHKHMEQF